MSVVLCATVLIAQTLRKSSTQNVLLRESLHRARSEAERDALTGIPNRKYFLRRLADTIASANHRPVAVLFADLDGFKAVIARIGGDEFAILIDRREDIDEAHAIAGQIERAIAYPFSVGERRFTLGITVGTSFYPRDASDAKTLLRISDARMYRQKAPSGASIIKPANTILWRDDEECGLSDLRLRRRAGRQRTRREQS